MSIDVQIVSENGTLSKYAHSGQTFVAAPKNGTYSIKLRNRSSKRKLVVISVDGRNIMDGESAGYDGQGYVLSPWQTAEIKGWRRTADEVAAFEFVAIEDSYDVKTGGTGKNVGVIGVAVFDEKEQWEYWSKSRGIPISSNYGHDSGQTLGIDGLIGSATSTTNSTTGSRRLTKSFRRETSESVGTGYGQKTEMKTTSTTFEKASDNPSEVVTLRYATEPTLRKWGVIREPVIPSVNPFPEEQVAVKPPPGWNG